MNDKPVYRWVIRRAAKTRREKHRGAISTHDLVILTIIMAICVVVLRIIFIFGTVLGMQIGPFETHPDLHTYKAMPYANLATITESFKELKHVSLALFIYWVAASWRNFSSKSVSLSTVTFKLVLGISTLTLLGACFLPEHAIEIANLWFRSDFRPQHKI